MIRHVRFPRWMLAAVLAPMLLGVQFTCEKTGNTNLYLLEIQAGGVNRLPAFDINDRTYTIVTDDATMMTVTAVSEDPQATVTWNLKGSGGYIGVGGGTVSMPIPDTNSELFVFVKAPGGASASYQVTINPICTLGSCDDGDPCTNDVCDTFTALCEFTGEPDGTPCDPGVPGPYECNAGVCQPLGCINDTGCDDSNVCTLDACTIETGACSNSAEIGVACGPGGTPAGVDPEDQGTCAGDGSCAPIDQCSADAECLSTLPPPADAQCTISSCDQTGFASVCRYDSVADGTSCTLAAGDPGLCNGGTCTECMETASQDPDCTIAECGDGTLNVTAGEACDDGNLIDDDGCDSDCTVGFIACGLDLSTCGAGDGCYPITTGAVCAPAGTTPEDAACNQQNDCEAGFGCVNRLVGSIGMAQCTELCDPVNGFTCSSGGPCSGLNTTSSIGSCQYDPCDPFDVASCDPGLACYPTTTAGDLCFDAGTTGAGGACASHLDCVAGTRCVDLNSMGAICMVVCDPANGDADCGPSELCNPLIGDPAIGVCVTP